MSTRERGSIRSEMRAAVERVKFVWGRNYDRIGVNPAAYEADVLLGGDRSNLAHLIGERIADNVFQKGVSPRVLDIAAGTGIGSRDLAERGFQVASMDLSHNMLNHLQENSEETISPLQADMNQSFPFDSDSFDAATSLWSNRYIKDPRHFLKETYRVLKPDGVMVWPIMPSSSIYWKILARRIKLPTQPDELAHVAAEVGFHDVKLVDAYGESLPAGNKYPVQFLIARK